MTTKQRRRSTYDPNELERRDEEFLRTLEKELRIERIDVRIKLPQAMKVDFAFTSPKVVS